MSVLINSKCFSTSVINIKCIAYIVFFSSRCMVVVFVFLITMWICPILLRMSYEFGFFTY